MQTWSKPVSSWKQIISQAPLRQPANSWNTDEYPINFPLKIGFTHFYITYSYADGVKATQHATIYWAPGVTESRSEVLQVEKNGSVYQFQYIYKSNGKLSIACRNAGGGNSAQFSWVAVWYKDEADSPDVI